MHTKTKGSSQEMVFGDGRAIVVRGADGESAFTAFMKKKTLGVPHWGWGLALAAVGLFHINK